MTHDGTGGVQHIVYISSPLNCIYASVYQKHTANQMGAEGNEGNLIEGHLIVAEEANDVAVSRFQCVIVALYYCIFSPILMKWCLTVSC